MTQKTLLGGVASKEALDPKEDKNQESTKNSEDLDTVAEDFIVENESLGGDLRSTVVPHYTDVDVALVRNGKKN